MIPDAEKIVITPELQAKIAATQAEQGRADELGKLAASAVRPGAVREAWVTVPELKEGPYTIRRVRDGDLKRLDELGHPVNSQKAMHEWANNPVSSGPEAWLLIWMFTRPIPEVKSAMIQGKDIVVQKAEDEFSELDGLQLALLSAKIGLQFAAYLGAQLDYEALPQEGQPSPPPLSQPPLTV